MKPTPCRLLFAFVFLILARQAGAAGVTVKDFFSPSVNYLTNGVVGTIWDGIYLGAGSIANPTGIGSVPGTVSIADASISSNGVLTVASLQTDWENSADDGMFLYKVV